MQFFSSIFGHMLYLLFNLTKNYAFSIVLFTLITKLLLLPMSIKQQKFSARNLRLASKREELEKKYKNNKQKLSEELFKLQEREQINPLSGCLSSLLPIVLLFGIYSAVVNPLSDMLHISGEKINSAVTALKTLPGFEKTTQYQQIQILQVFQPNIDLFNMFSSEEVKNILNLEHGFNLFNLDLLLIPKNSSFSSFLWLIPVLCFLTQVISSYFSVKLQGNVQSPVNQGCMKYLMYFTPLLSAWFAYIAPAAVGFYWIVSTIFNFIQTVILMKYYNTHAIIAHDEAARISRRILEEEKIYKNK